MNMIQQYPDYVWSDALHIVVNSLTSDYDGQGNFTINLGVGTKTTRADVLDIKISHEDGERILGIINSVVEPAKVQ